jgi:hypothetical protein
VRRGLAAIAVAVTLALCCTGVASAATGWKVQAVPLPSGTNGKLFGVSCTSADSCIAVGQYTKAKSDVMLAEHWNGRTWAVQATPSGSHAIAELVGVSCVSPATCTAVGLYYTTISGPSVALAEQE